LSHGQSDGFNCTVSGFLLLPVLLLNADGRVLKEPRIGLQELRTVPATIRIRSTAYVKLFLFNIYLTAKDVHEWVQVKVFSIRFFPFK